MSRIPDPSVLRSVISLLSQALVRLFVSTVTMYMKNALHLFALLEGIHHSLNHHNLVWRPAQNIVYTYQLAVCGNSTDSKCTMEEDEFTVCEFTQRKISTTNDERIVAIRTEVDIFEGSVNRASEKMQ